MDSRHHTGILQEKRRTFQNRGRIQYLETNWATKLPSWERTSPFLRPPLSRCYSFSQEWGILNMTRSLQGTSKHHPHGFWKMPCQAVQVSPVTEHVLGYQWWAPCCSNDDWSTNPPPGPRTLARNTPWKINGWFTYKSPTRKGKWSEPNLHEDMFHLNLQGCKALWSVLMIGGGGVR